MIYIVALVEYGRVTHKWHFNCICDAVRQLERLLFAYDEVNEVSPILIKVGPAQTELKLKDILSTYVYE